MRSFSYVLAAFVVTVLVVGSLSMLVSRPLERIVREWVSAFPLCAVIVVSNRDGVIYQRLFAPGDEGYTGELRSDRSIRFTSISHGLTVVAIVGARADWRAGPLWRLMSIRRREGRFVTGGIATAARFPRT
jgi:hypothetical protein